VKKKTKNEIATSHKTLLAMTGRVDEIATSHKTLLAMTGRVDEIATSSNQRTVGFLAMTEQEKTQIPLTPFSKEGN
jgi:hypothetical protein